MRENSIIDYLFVGVILLLFNIFGAIGLFFIFKQKEYNHKMVVLKRVVIIYFIFFVSISCFGFFSYFSISNSDEFKESIAEIENSENEIFKLIKSEVETKAPGYKIENCSTREAIQMVGGRYEDGKIVDFETKYTKIIDGKAEYWNCTLYLRSSGPEKDKSGELRYENEKITIKKDISVEDSRALYDNYTIHDNFENIISSDVIYKILKSKIDKPILTVKSMSIGGSNQRLLGGKYAWVFETNYGEFKIDALTGQIIAN